MYTCSKVQNCVITLKTRKNCQFCRFRLCEKAGMKRSWVLADSDCKTAKVIRINISLKSKVVTVAVDSSNVFALLQG